MLLPVLAWQLMVLILHGCSTWPEPERASDALVLADLHGKDAGPSDARPTALELQARLMSYADRYLANAAEATATFERAVNTREAKDFALSTFVFPSLATIGIAAGDDPGSDLLDMVVLATLQHRVLADGWAREVLGDNAKPLLETQAKLERQVWHIAAEVLSPSQQNELRATIDHWRQENPHQRFVSAVRFDELARVRGQDWNARMLDASDGLLAPIDEAVRKAEELRLLAERGIYLMQRMPPLILAQARYVVHESVAPDQIKHIVKDFSDISATFDGAQKTFATLPGLISSERQALFREWDNRQAALARLVSSATPVLEAGKGVTSDVNATVAAADKLFLTYQQSGTVLNETLRRYEALQQYLDSQPSSDPNRLPQILHLLIRLGQEINSMAGPPETRSAPAARALWSGLLSDTLDALLWRMIALVAAFLSLLLLYRYLARRFLGEARGEAASKGP